MPIRRPAPLRLFEHNGPLSGLRLGFVCSLALVLGVPALLWSVDPAREAPTAVERAFAHRNAELAGDRRSCSTARWRAFTPATPRASHRPSPRPPASASRGRCATGSGSGWAQSPPRSHSRSTVAGCSAGPATIGACSRSARSSQPWPAPSRRHVRACRYSARASRLRRSRSRWTSTHSLIANHEFDSGRTGAMATSEVDTISAYIERARAARPLRVRRGRPERGRRADRPGSPADPLADLLRRRTSCCRSRGWRRSSTRGRAALRVLDGGCGPRTPRSSPACSAGAAWVRAHGVDVSRCSRPAARVDVLYLLRNALASVHARRPRRRSRSSSSTTRARCARR